MEKQKICIVGGGLTGLITAITLSKLILQIDLITDENYNKKTKTNRTSVISKNNYDFLKKLNKLKKKLKISNQYHLKPKKKYWDLKILDY